MIYNSCFGSNVVDLLSIVAPIMRFLYLLRRERIALLCLSSWCLVPVIVLWLFLMMHC